MPLFTVSKTNLRAVPQRPFPSEKALQRLIESNLDVVFKCRLVATEFSTGAQHAGRIDTLALSEDNNPVIIEYKNVESSDLITQSLFYLAWIHDHKGDFEIAAQVALSEKIQVDWSAVRVICIAPNYRKYDLHAVRVTGAGLELWTYRLFKNDVIYLEEVFQKSDPGVGAPDGAKNPVMVKAGQKAALARATGSYTFDQHVMNRTGFLGDLISWEDGVYGTSKSVFPGGARACRPDGRGAPGGPRLRVGGAAVGGAEARLHGGDAAEVGAAGAA